MDSRPIGMFDSGVGGMTVLKEVKKKLPNEKIIYLGDTKRFPYGSKSKETIIELTKRGIEFFIKKDVKAIIIACGTATSQAIDTVSKMYNIPIIGIIEPTVNYILKQKNIKNIGVIATAGTIRSNGWEKALKEKNSELNIINKACPLLAPMAEEGWTNNEVASLAVKEYLKDINNIDALILGCTHYPLFEDVIKKELGDTVEIINTGKMIADFIKELFEKENMLNLDNNNLYEIYLTDIECNFVNVAKKLINEELSVNKTEI
ncbi:MAG: glutamate racemase [Clostridia bacterium]|jgi:glutamate racemase|nr:glutamate racemase [Clostridium sp. CAG:571]HJJ06403.1 glutamate racemase [Clostridiaceae bacterium]